MTLALATNPNVAAEHPGENTIAGATTPDPTPTPSAAEVTSALFASDAGGVGYLFGHDALDAVPTPLEDVPVTAPDHAALAMSAVNEGAARDNAHVSAMPDIPTPVAGGETNVPLAEPTAPAAQPSTLRQTLAQEGQRIKDLFVKLGGQVNG